MKEKSKSTKEHNLCYGKGNEPDICWSCQVIFDCAIKQGKKLTDIKNEFPDIEKRQEKLRSPLYRNSNNPICPDLMERNE